MILKLRPLVTKRPDQQTALIDQLTSVEIQLQQLVRAQQDLVDKVNTTGQAVAKMRASLDTQVAENTEAIAAIDAYRIATTNSRFRDLEQRLEALRANANTTTLGASKLTDQSIFLLPDVAHPLGQHDLTLSVVCRGQLRQRKLPDFDVHIVTLAL